MQNHFQNHPKGQICPVFTVGWPMLSGFVVEGWKSDFCDSSRVKIILFPNFYPKIYPSATNYRLFWQIKEYGSTTR